MQIVSDHGFPKANDDESALDAFKNEREYIAQSGRLKTTVAAMDWAMREIERLTADRDALLQQALGVEAERDIARFEIERLTVENGRLRAALTEVVFMSGMPIDIPPEDMLANAGATAMTALDPQKYGVDQQQAVNSEEGK